MVVDGIYYALGLIGGGLIAGYFTRPALGIPFYVLAAFCLYFFPDRAVPDGPVAVSPADGKVVAIQRYDPGSTRISIFLNIFDVHVNRSPIGGKIGKVQYEKGRFMVASKEGASSSNERNIVTVEGEGSSVVFAQIAGLIARRIVFYKHSGDRVEKGERVGLIKFGSRVDVFLGPEWDVAVETGARVACGSSILARRKQT